MKKALVLLHKWLGVALALLFLMWFASGVVLYFVPFPRLTEGERLAALPVLHLPAGCCLTAEEAAGRARLQFTEARLGLLGDRRVWRMLATDQEKHGVAAGAEPAGTPRWLAVDARTGTRLAPLAPAQAAGVAAAFAGRQVLAAEVLERDQWTVPQGLDPYRPLVKVRLGGQDGLELYVSSTAGEVVRDTRAAERFWNWLGAVPHWIYPTVLRQFPWVWHQVVVWLSIPALLLAASGLVLGIWQLFLNRSRWIPYGKRWMRWHHMAGLAAGLCALGWIFSGLLSMNPFGVFSPRVLPPAERQAWAGAPAVASLGPAEALAAAGGLGSQVRELDLLRFAGQTWYRLRGASAGEQWLIRAVTAGEGKGAATVQPRLPDAAMRASLAALRPAAGVSAIHFAPAYDGLYYSRDPGSADAGFTRPLPVWRAEWADGTRVYADPASGRVLLRADGSGRWQRVLYNGLHSLDFAPLLARPWLRHGLVLGLSLLGLALCLTSCAIAWRVIMPRRPAQRQAYGQARDMLVPVAEDRPHHLSPR